jgi:hypothetical protein
MTQKIKTTSRRVLFCLILLLGVACSSPTPSEQDIDAAEYAVYSSLINTRYVIGEVQLIVIQDQTDSFLETDPSAESVKYIRDQMPDLDKDTLASFQARNEQSSPLRADLDLNCQYVFIAQGELSAIFENQTGWDTFYEQYPKSQGVMTLSRVGFNRAMDQALVYVGNQSYWLAGAGYYVLFVKENGTWQLAQEVMTWIS